MPNRGFTVLAVDIEFPRITAGQVVNLTNGFLFAKANKNTNGTPYNVFYNADKKTVVNWWGPDPGKSTQWTWQKLIDL